MTLHVLDQLPLWVEGDLSAADLAAVEHHLAKCPACHAVAERLRTSQVWLREAMQPPFVPIDHEHLRHAVMAQIRTEAAAKPVHRLAAIRPTLLAACVASLLIATLIWRQEHATVSLPPLGVPSALPAGSATQTAPVVTPPMARQDLARVAPLKAPLRRPEEPVSSPIEGPARIEFQTANPNIRIIWLAQAKPLPEMNPTPLEAP
ncbi:anti-sigma factor family protein [Geothrix fermentans]|uniref:anti-sigma factor family protein n=1 Tax=Geothrix fermentans TaxID=44676 RepID=UPI00040B5249|nr:zf-HC2 domain-containing protein [Geothrix fermentans]